MNFEAVNRSSRVKVLNDSAERNSVTSFLIAPLPMQLKQLSTAMLLVMLLGAGQIGRAHV